MADIVKITFSDLVSSLTTVTSSDDLSILAIKDGVAVKGAVSLIKGDTGEDGSDGESIMLQVADDYIQWKLESDTSWTDLIAIADLKGNTGDTGNAGTDGVDGEDGREVEFQNNGTYIQWKYSDETTWTNLVALADITGEDGEDGNGSGDMLASTYDTDGDGKVDSAESADEAASLADTAEVPASQVTLDTTNFDNNLSSSDATVQEAMETLDALIASSENSDSLNIDGGSSSSIYTASQNLDGGDSTS
jgi:hypothetical protein